MKQGKVRSQPSAFANQSKKKIQKEVLKNSKTKPVKKNLNTDTNLILAGLIILTVIVYLRALSDGFTNWDEDEYIVGNPLLHSYDLKAIFTHYLSGNYHPLTELLLAVEYHLWGLMAAGYHTVNLLLHISNVVLVFYAIYLLSKKTAVAFITALLFAVHPLHVESVAWTAELKDLLYTFFFLASYICYIRYTMNQKSRIYILSIILFLFALLSKAMAASLPVLLILTDYFNGRKINSKTLLEKVPFFVLALILGFVAISAQRSVGGIQEVPAFPLYQRAVFACYGFITYFFKLIVPVDLSAFYPYPDKSGAGIPSSYYFYPLMLAAVVVMVIYSLRFSKKIFFGLGFFAITVFLVLQLLPVGMAIMADRYSYIPSIGFFYLVAEGFYWLYNEKRMRIPAVTLIAAAVGVFSYATYERCAVWKDGMTLWDDMLSKHPDVSFAYNNRGILLLNDKKYDEALVDFNNAIKLQPRYPHALNNRGIIFSNLKKYEEAKINYDLAIQYEPTYDEAYMNRGVMLNEEGKYAEAINDFSKKLEFIPNYPLAYYDRARAEYALKQKESACADLQKAISLNYEPAQDAFDHLCH